MAIRRSFLIVTAGLLLMAGTGSPAGAVRPPRPTLDAVAPVGDVPAPWFWDDDTHLRAGGDANRFELDDPARAVDLSTWYYLSFVVGGDRLRVHDHNPATTRGPDSDIAHSENVAWHVANVALGRAAGSARPEELPDWSRPRTGGVDGTSAGLLFALADVDLLTPGRLAGNLRVGATGTIGSDGTVTAVRMADVKLAAAELANADVVFGPEFPTHAGNVTVAVSHVGAPAARRTIGDWLNTDAYETAGRAATQPGRLALVRVDDIRQALAWLCGHIGTADTCAVAHRAAGVSLALARPFTLPDFPLKPAGPSQPR